MIDINFSGGDVGNVMSKRNLRHFSPPPVFSDGKYDRDVCDNNSQLLQIIPAIC